MSVNLRGYKGKCFLARLWLKRYMCGIGRLLRFENVQIGHYDLNTEVFLFRWVVFVFEKIEKPFSEQIFVVLKIFYDSLAYRIR